MGRKDGLLITLMLLSQVTNGLRRFAQAKNYWDIAILTGTNALYYTDLIALSSANNGAVIEDQRTTPRSHNITFVDASFSGDGSPLNPFQTIASALAATVAGGTINVLAGTYNETIDIQKPLSLLGEGAATTTIDVSANSSAGNVVAIHNLTGNVTVDGFTIRTGPATSVASSGFVVGALTGTGLVTISNNVIWCIQSSLGTPYDNMAFYAYSSTPTDGTLVFNHNVIHGGTGTATDGVGNPVLVEQWLGQITLTNNTIDDGISNATTNDIIFIMNHDASNISAKYLISGNTIDMVSSSALRTMGTTSPLPPPTAMPMS